MLLGLSSSPNLKSFLKEESFDFGISECLQPRPDPNLFSAKRKASASPAADAVELSTYSEKKKTKEEWTCALCQVSATSEKGLKEHLEGKKHKTKESSLARKIGKEGNTEAQVNQEPEDSKKLSRLKMVQKSEKAEGSRKRKNFQFWCEICQVGAFSQTVMDSHRNGKKHIARLRELHQDEVGCAVAEDPEKNSREPKESTET